MVEGGGGKVASLIFFLFLSFSFFLCSVPTFVNLPEETLIKIADVLEEVGVSGRPYCLLRKKKRHELTVIQLLIIQVPKETQQVCTCFVSGSCDLPWENGGPIKVPSPPPTHTK